MGVRSDSRIFLEVLRDGRRIEYDYNADNLRTRRIVRPYDGASDGDSVITTYEYDGAYNITREVTDAGGLALEKLTMRCGHHVSTQFRWLSHQADGC
jgi:YD repeat-containing protein